MVHLFGKSDADCRISVAVHIPDTLSPALDLLLNWLYGHDPPVPTDGKSLHNHLVLLSLSSQYNFEYLYNFTMDNVRRYLRAAAAPISAMNLAYMYTHLQGSRLRQLMIDATTHQHLQFPGAVDEEFFSSIKKNGALATDVYRSVVQGSQRLQSRITTARDVSMDCEYHVHEKTASCNTFGALAMGTPTTVPGLSNGM